MDLRDRLSLVTLASSLVVVCDQLSKRMAAALLASAPTQSYLGDLVRLHYAENPGAFLSLGAGLPEEARHWLMVVGLGLLLLGILLFAVLKAGLSPLAIVSLGLILGGGIGNWVDRLRYGNVVIDFLIVGIGPLRSGVFNLADLFIEGGLVLLAVAYFRQRRHDSHPQPGN